MNNKYLFNGENWIVTSGEIKITQLHGTRPMHPALSKKLYDKNATKFTKPTELLYFGLPANLRYVFPYEITPFKIVPGRIPPQLKDIATTITTINKYTIVELTHNNKHYHGLASRADCDKENAVSGIAVAYHRAFEKMMDGFKIGVATYDENSPKMQGSSPNKSVEDDDCLDHMTHNPMLHNKNISVSIHESINALKATGKEPTEIRIKPAVAEKLRRELEIKHEWFGGERFIKIDKYFGLKYIIDPSINVDIIIN